MKYVLTTLALMGVAITVILAGSLFVSCGGNCDDETTSPEELVRTIFEAMDSEDMDTLERLSDEGYVPYTEFEMFESVFKSQQMEISNLVIVTQEQTEDEARVSAEYDVKIVQENGDITEDSHYVAYIRLVKSKSLDIWRLAGQYAKSEYSDNNEETEKKETEFGWVEKEFHDNTNYRKNEALEWQCRDSTIINVSSEELCREYELNKEIADSNYLNKCVQVTGSLMHSSFERFEDYYIYHLILDSGVPDSEKQSRDIAGVGVSIRTDRTLRLILDTDIKATGLCKGADSLVFIEADRIDFSTGGNVFVE